MRKHMMCPADSSSDLQIRTRYVSSVCRILNLYHTLTIATWGKTWKSFRKRVPLGNSSCGYLLSYTRSSWNLFSILMSFICIRLNPVLSTESCLDCSSASLLAIKPLCSLLISYVDNNLFLSLFDVLVSCNKHFLLLSFCTCYFCNFLLLIILQSLSYF